MNAARSSEAPMAIEAFRRDGENRIMIGRRKREMAERWKRLAQPTNRQYLPIFLFSRHLKAK
jgi:hypothetical protein